MKRRGPHEGNEKIKKKIIFYGHNCKHDKVETHLISTNVSDFRKEADLIGSTLSEV